LRRERSRIAPKACVSCHLLEGDRRNRDAARKATYVTPITEVAASLDERRFPPPWSVDETNDACFIVRDHNGEALAYVYEGGRRSAYRRLGTRGLSGAAS